MIEKFEIIHKLLNAYEQYQEYEQSIEELNSECPDILYVKTVISSEIYGLVDSIIDSDVSEEFKKTLYRLRTEIQNTCGGSDFANETEILANNYAEFLTMKLRREPLNIDILRNDKYIEFRYTSKIKKPDILVITKTKDNNAYLITIIDLNEMVQNVFQLRSDAEKYDDFLIQFKGIIERYPNIIMLGEHPSCLIESPKENQNISLLDGEISPRIKVDYGSKLAMNGDKMISISELIKIASSVNPKREYLQKNIRELAMKKYKKSDIYFYRSGYGTILEPLSKLHTLVRIHEIENKFQVIVVFYAYDECGVNLEEHAVIFSIGENDLEVEKVIDKSLSHRHDESFFEKTYKPFIIESQDSIWQLFEFLSGRNGYKEEKIYAAGNMLIKITNKNFTLTLDGKHTIEYCLGTKKYTTDSPSPRGLKELKENYHSILRDVKIPITETPKWMQKEVYEYIENPVQLQLSKKRGFSIFNRKPAKSLNENLVAQTILR